MRRGSRCSCATWLAECKAIPSRARRSRWRSGISTDAPSAFRCIASWEAACGTVCRSRGRSRSPIPTRRSTRRGQRSRAAIASSRSRRRRGRWRRTSQRIRRLREALGPAISLRVDANQGWDRPTALKAIRALEPFDLDFVEQPVPRWDLDGMAEIGRRVDVPIMADESCFSPQDALAIARLGGVSILGAQADEVRRRDRQHGHRADRRSGRHELLRGLHDRDVAGHRRLPARRGVGGAGRVGMRAVRPAPAQGRRRPRARALRGRSHRRPRWPRARGRGR